MKLTEIEYYPHNKNQRPIKPLVTTIGWQAKQGKHRGLGETKAEAIKHLKHILP